jgi:hypothetical protein
LAQRLHLPTGRLDVTAHVDLKRAFYRGKSREGAPELDWLELYLARRGAGTNHGGADVCISAHLLGANLLALLRMGALCEEHTLWTSGRFREWGRARRQSAEGLGR